MNECVVGCSICNVYLKAANPLNVFGEIGAFDLTSCNDEADDGDGDGDNGAIARCDYATRRLIT